MTSGNDPISSILIVGGDSTIGKALVNAYGLKDIYVWETTRNASRHSERSLNLDLLHDEQDWSLPSKPINVAFLCAAITSEEQCRSYPEASREVNVYKTVLLAKRLIDTGVFVVFISTNAVFNGESPYPQPADIATPITEYGRQKVATENELMKFGDRVSIIRFGKIINQQMPLFQHWHDNLRTGNIIYPFHDMLMAPICLPFQLKYYDQ